MTLDASDRLAIEHQTVLGLPPVEFVHLAADLDVRSIAIALITGPDNPHGYEPFSLRDDPALRRRMLRAVSQSGVSISLGEGFTVRPEHDIRDRAADLDVMAELGAPRVNTVSMDPDLSRTLDEFATLAEMAAARGLLTTIEFAPSLTIDDLDSAVAALHHIDRPDVGLLIDTMHLVRAGHTVDDLIAIDPELIRYAQLSDHTTSQRGQTYRDDTMDRMPPGEGELPLHEIVAALPPAVTIGIEIPMRSRAEAGESTEQRVRRCVEGARRLLGEVAGDDRTTNDARTRSEP